MSDLTRKTVAATVRAVGDRKVETIASTSSLDREGDRILASAWRLDAYKKNPIVLFAHDYAALPVARSTSIRVVGGALTTVDEFPPVGVYPFADTVYEMVRAGYVGAKSVGFRPLAWEPNDHHGRDYTEVELLEHSYVAVPANPEALVTAKTKAFDRARLDAFLSGAGRDLDLNEAQVLMALRAGIRALVERGLGDAMRPPWARVPREVEILDLDDEVDPRAFAAALRETLPAMIRDAVDRTLPRVLNQARGRVD